MSAGADRIHRMLGAGVGALCALVILGPALQPGYLLFYDMVFVPRLQLSPRVLGVDGAVPRAVPNDLIVALASAGLPGWIAQKVLLVAVFVGAGAGVAALVRGRLATVVAAVAICWNPYVGQRLAIGHWGFLLGYAMLPWIASAAAGVRQGCPRSRARLAVALVLSAATGSTGAVLGIVLALAVLLIGGSARPARARLADLGWVGLIALLANAPWWWPFLTTPAARAADGAGVEAFMARADTPLGLIPSLVTGGAIWNRGVWFAERESLWLSIIGLGAIVLSAAVWGRIGGWRQHPALPGLAVSAVLGLLVAGAAGLPGGRTAMRWVVTEIPGGGLLRDSQKFLALWMLLVAVVLAAAAESVRAWLRRQRASQLSAVAIAVAAPAVTILTLTGLAWGGHGRWAAVDYPTGHLAIARRIESGPPGAVAVFPWTLYRRYAWNGDRVVLDPWQRLVSRTVVVNDDLPLSDRVVRGESTEAAAVSAALRQGDPRATLRRVGVRYVVQLTDQPPVAASPSWVDQRPVLTAPGVALYDLGPVGATQAPVASWRYLGLAAGMLSLVLTVVAWCWPSRRPRGRH